tara:strand:- start:18266 stop:20635 length:2370 start_codon:yes stop_codon:yes gene_type:complete
MKKTLLTLLVTFLSVVSNSQEKKSIENSYVDYFNLPRETLFLHTNKTTYFSGEELWLNIYAYDRKNNLSSKTTSNIYLGIYDDSGKQIDKKLFLAKNGVAKGNIAIDSSFTTGTYFLKAYTNWMRNFKEDDAYIQKIRIINPDSEEIISKKINTKEYDIQFLPEGGYLLSDVKNSIGIKAINDKGKGTIATGIVVNSKGIEVASFKSNIFGVGKFTFTPINGETYSAKIKLSNYKELVQDLPKAENIGIALTVNNLKKEQVIINLSLNENSLESFKGKEYKVLIHKDGEAKSIPIIIDNKIERISIEKTGLFKGVNTITVFNERKQPILERMFFNDVVIENKSIVLVKKQVAGDSISYQLSSNIKKDEIINASVSVLPKETISYKPEHSIISAFYLKPYLKGAIENPQYYFNNVNRKKKYELDLLLLTQGWSRYSWDNIMNFPPKPNFDFENGISINGFLNTTINKVKSLFLYPTRLNKSSFIPTDVNGKFELKNFYPIVGDYIRFSYIDKKEKTKKPSMALSFLKLMQTDSINVNSYETFISFYSNKNNILNGFIDEKSEVLDEIVLKVTKEKEKRKNYRLPFRGKLFHVDRTLFEKYFDLGNFLDNNGFVVDNIGLNPTQLGRSAIRHNFPRRGPVVIYLNNMQIRGNDIVLNRGLDEFEDIFIDDTPNANMASVGGGVATFVVVIKLFTRKTSLWDVEAASKINSTKVKYGFQPKKKFYSPKYYSYQADSFKNYGAIHWEPSITIKSMEAFDLTTINTGLDEITFYIEGISSDGSVFSQVVKVVKE